MSYSDPDSHPSIALPPEVDTSSLSVGPSCASCKYWFRLPADPQNLTAPRQGECKHHLVALPLLGKGPQVTGWVGGFPPTPADFWCGQYTPRINGG